LHVDCALAISPARQHRRNRCHADAIDPKVSPDGMAAQGGDGKVSLAKEVGTTIRVAITEWPQTLRLISLLAAMTGPLSLIVVLVILLRA
jgi:hypothetical protein